MAREKKTKPANNVAEITYGNGAKQYVKYADLTDVREHALDQVGVNIRRLTAGEAMDIVTSGGTITKIEAKSEPASDAGATNTDAGASDTAAASEDTKAADTAEATTTKPSARGK